MIRLLRKNGERLFLSILVFLCCYPILFLLTGALMGKGELTDWLGPVLSGGEGFGAFPLVPRFPTLEACVEVLLDSPEFFVMFWNSVKITVGILFGQMVVGIPAAWGFARYEFPLKKFLFTVYMILMMMPFQVTMLSNYLVLDKIGLMDTLWSVIFPGMFSTFPVFLMYRFFKSIPEEILESARMDGAGEIRIFITIGIPLGSSGIISAAVLGFLEYWNLIEQPLTFLKKKSLWPLSLYLPAVDIENTGQALAASILALIPALLVFLAGQDYLEQGIGAALKE